MENADKTRAARGESTASSVLGVDGLGDRTPFRAAARDFVFSEVWARPGLDRRSRFWITLSCVCAAGAPLAMRTYIRAALKSGEVSLAELQEFILHFAVFQGFPKAAQADALLEELAGELTGTGPAA